MELFGSWGVGGIVVKLIVAARQIFGELVIELSLAEQNIAAKQHLLESYILR